MINSNKTWKKIVQSEGKDGQLISNLRTELVKNPRLSSENELIADWLLRLTTTHKQWGFGLCFMYLLYHPKTSDNFLKFLI